MSENQSGMAKNMKTIVDKLYAIDKVAADAFERVRALEENINASLH